MKTYEDVRAIILIISFSLFSFWTNAETVRQWDVYSISFTSEKSFTNPYNEIPVTKVGDRITVTFQGTAGDALNKSITVVGFWNGGKEWRVNFTAPNTGSWKYTEV
jgi:hypothetical protein